MSVGVSCVEREQPWSMVPVIPKGYFFPSLYTFSSLFLPTPEGFVEGRENTPHYCSLHVLCGIHVPRFSSNNEILALPVLYPQGTPCPRGSFSPSGSVFGHFGQGGTQVCQRGTVCVEAPSRAQVRARTLYEL